MPTPLVVSGSAWRRVLGAWLVGKLYDVTGNYNTVWMLTIALGVFAAIVHLPIDERALESRTPALA